MKSFLPSSLATFLLASSPISAAGQAPTPTDQAKQQADSTAKKAQKASPAGSGTKAKDGQAGAVEVPPPATSDKARKQAGAAPRPADKSLKAEMDRKAKQIQAGAAKGPSPASPDDAKKIGGATATEPEKTGGAPRPTLGK